MRTWSDLGGQKGARIYSLPEHSGNHFRRKSGKIRKKTSKKSMQKSMSKKYRKMMPKVTENDAKIDTKIDQFSNFSENG